MNSLVSKPAELRRLRRLLLLPAVALQGFGTVLSNKGTFMELSYGLF